MDDLGADGVTVETNTHGVYLGDTRYEPLYAELDRRRTPVFVHPTPPRRTPRTSRSAGPVRCWSSSSTRPAP
ncbi:hypothetical protein ABZ341_37645 [Streptomyces sp. NPDC006173]|uniref:hypothetical protein n=1 Tax=Streptomyces sp. NPDC006173 TaxID=3155349 RepID=UPI0033E0F3E8